VPPPPKGKKKKKEREKRDLLKPFTGKTVANGETCFFPQINHAFYLPDLAWTFNVFLWGKSWA
jgi:hypothetical protein